VSAVEAFDTAAPPAGTVVPPHALAQRLYERHSKRILGFCVRRLPTREEAEDAVQTTFLYALRALQRGVVPVSETAWLFKIAENVCLATHRTNGRRREHELAEAPEVADDLSDREGSRELGIELVKAIALIPGNQRRALLLREWKGLSYREIAGQLGVSVAAVETLIFRARRRVARTLGESGVKGRLAGAFDLSSVFSTLKTALGGGATVAKIAAAAALVTIATALPAGDAPKASAKPPAAVAAPASTAKPVSSPVSAGQVSAAKPSSSKRNRPGSAARDKPNGPVGHASGAGRPAGRDAAAANQPPAGANRPPSGPALPTAPPVQPPALPPVSLPDLPAAPQLPSVPELPKVPAVPQVPQVPEVPPLPDVPALPQLP